MDVSRSVIPLSLLVVVVAAAEIQRGRRRCMVDRLHVARSDAHASVVVVDTMVGEWVVDSGNHLLQLVPMKCIDVHSDVVDVPSVVD